MEQQSERLLSFSFLLGTFALIGWIAYVTTATPRVWLAVAVVSTVACAAMKLQATLLALGARLPREETPPEEPA